MLSDQKQCHCMSLSLKVKVIAKIKSKCLREQKAYHPKTKYRIYSSISHTFFIPENQSKNGGDTYTQGYVK